MIVLPANVYDTLELSALAFGGVGQGRAVDDDGTPLCAAGHAMVVDGFQDALRDPLWCALSRAIGGNRGIGDWNDAAFKPGEGRIPFEEWCRRLNVVRGE